MSNLLNNGKPKKRLLDRGPKIVPTQEFKLEEAAEVKEGAPVQEEQQSKPTPTPKSTPKTTTKPKSAPKSTTKSAEETIARKTKKREEIAAQITSVRVTKSTRNKLNTLIQLGKADSVDVLVDMLLDEYIENSLAKDEKKTFDLVFDVIQKRDR